MPIPNKIVIVCVTILNSHICTQHPATCTQQPSWCQSLMQSIKISIRSIHYHSYISFVYSYSVNVILHLRSVTMINQISIRLVPISKYVHQTNRQFLLASTDTFQNTMVACQSLSWCSCTYEAIHSSNSLTIKDIINVCSYEFTTVLYDAGGQVVFLINDCSWLTSFIFIVCYLNLIVTPQYNIMLMYY